MEAVGSRSAADVGISTIYEFEPERRAVSDEAVGKMRAALEKAGVEFIDGKRPGVRVK